MWFVHSSLSFLPLSLFLPFVFLFSFFATFSLHLSLCSSCYVSLGRDQKKRDETKLEGITSLFFVLLTRILVLFSHHLFFISSLSYPMISASIFWHWLSRKEKKKKSVISCFFFRSHPSYTYPIFEDRSEWETSQNSIPVFSSDPLKELLSSSINQAIWVNSSNEAIIISSSNPFLVKTEN